MRSDERQTNCDSLALRLNAVRARIASAARRSGRDPDDVDLIAVSKTRPAEKVLEAMDAGQCVFGENRLQEARAKMDAVATATSSSAPAPEWHLIGHLQTNKARDAVGRFALIHSVDSVRLVAELERRAAAREVTQAILLQVNVSGETSKFGVTPEALGALLDAVDAAPHLRAEGLMTIPPFSSDPEAARPYFARLHDLWADVADHPARVGRHLSMGMSGDFEVAVEEGATLVRVGTALFGPRTVPAT